MEHMPTAYEGKQPYIFVSYAHKDAARVLPVIESLVKSGFRVWYDAGIEAGTEWPEYIAAHLADAVCVLAFLSPASINSLNCRQEITFALSRDRAMLTVFLEDVKLPLGLEMQLGLTQAMFYYHHGSVESFARELVKAEVIADCREETPSLPENAEKPAPSAAQSGVSLTPEAVSAPAASAPAASAPAPASDAPALFNLKNDEMTVVDGVLERYHGQRERVEIPEGVTVIASEAFKRNAALKSIRLPRSLVTIRAWAFADCPALEEITIPGGVEVVSSNLFVGSGLKRVILSEGVTTVGIATFKDCASLSYVGLPKSLKTIGEEAFKGCKSLTRVHLPEGISYAKEGNKRSFPATVKFVDENGVLLQAEKKAAPTPPPAPKPLFDIIDGVLRACRGECKRITIPVSAKEIGACVFLNHTELLTVNVPGTVRKIGKSAFEGCKNLELVTFAHGLFEIGDWAFKGCEKLEFVDDIPDTVTKIGAHAFCGCKNLNTLQISASVKEVGAGAFDDCPALKEIKISKKAPCYRALKKMLPEHIKLVKV